MKKSRKYLSITGLGVLAALVLMTVASRLYMTDSILYVPERTSAAQLAQLANFTKIRVQGDFSLELTQVQDYSIEYSPLSANQGELTARVESDTLVIEGFGNRTDTGVAVLHIGVPVLDTLEVLYLPQITVSNFIAPLMNVRLVAFGSFTMQNNMLGSLDLVSRGAGELNLRGNMLTTQHLHIDGRSDLNISAE